MCNQEASRAWWNCYPLWTNCSAVRRSHEQRGRDNGGQGKRQWKAPTINNSKKEDGGVGNTLATGNRHLLPIYSRETAQTCSLVVSYSTTCLHNLHVTRQNRAATVCVCVQVYWPLPQLSVDLSHCLTHWLLAAAAWPYDIILYSSMVNVVSELKVPYE